MSLVQLRTLAPVRVASTANVDLGTLAALDLMDTVELAQGDRILIGNQSDASENGVYDLTDSGPVRSVDMNSLAQVASGVLVPVVEGSVNGGKAFTVIPDGSEALDTVDLLVSEYTAWSPASPALMASAAFDNTPPEAMSLGAQTHSNDPPEALDLSSMNFTSDPPESFELS